MQREPVWAVPPGGGMEFAVGEVLHMRSLLGWLWLPQGHPVATWMRWVPASVSDSSGRQTLAVLVLKMDFCPGNEGAGDKAG